MKCLLDTHTLLWLATDSPKLSIRVRTLWEDERTEALLSVASLWEAAIKVKPGRLHLGDDFSKAMSFHMQKADATLLPVSLSHCALIAELPFHHRDPFDRMIAAQPLADSIPLPGADTVFDSYGVERIW